MEIDVLNPKVERLVKKKARAVFNVPLEREDIEQELREAIIDYCNSFDVDKRSMGAIHNIINQKMFRLIRYYSKFEGCSNASKEARRKINNPISLQQPIKTNADGEISLMLTIPNSRHVEYDEIVISDFLDTFIKKLTPTEMPIFNLMIQGFNKPRFVCQEMFDKFSQSDAKTISKHMINIKRKFTEDWSIVYGKTNLTRR